MNLQSIAQDVQTLEKALKLIEKTKNGTHFDKGRILFAICTEISKLEYKAHRQNEILTQLQNQ